MAENKQPEVPQQVREAVVETIGQARTAYNQLMEAAHRAQDMLKTIAPSIPAAAGLPDVQERAMREPRCEFRIGERACRGDGSSGGATNPEPARAVANACLYASGAGAWRDGDRGG